MYSSKNLLSALTAWALITSAPAAAFSAPSMPSVSSYDEIRLPDGGSCRSANYGPQLQLGALAGQGASDSNDRYDERYGYKNQRRDEAGVYAQLIIPIGGGERIDCSALYDLMVKQKKLELEELRARIEEAETRAKMAGLDLPKFK